MNLGTAAQQAEFDSFFAEEGDDHTTRISNGGSLRGTIGSGQATQYSVKDTTSQQQQQTSTAGSAVSWWKSCFFMFAIETYQPFFDVDSVDVQHRITSSLKYFNETNGFWNRVLPRTNTRHPSDSNELPYPGQEQQLPGIKRTGSLGPDLYGPFWMATTLILVVTMTSNLQNYLTQPKGYRENFSYDVTLLVHAIWILYGFVFVVPLFFYFVIQCLLNNSGNNNTQLPSYVDLISLYGYSLPPFFFGTIASGILPFSVVQWIALISSTLVSLIFVLRNVVSFVMGVAFHRPVEGDDFSNTDDEVDSPRTGGIYAQRAKGGPVLGSMIGVHFIFCLILKFGFYHQYATAT